MITSVNLYFLLSIAFFSLYLYSFLESSKPALSNVVLFNLQHLENIDMRTMMEVGGNCQHALVAVFGWISSNVKLILILQLLQLKK